MSSPRRILVLGGIALAIFAMLFGLHYAIFVEHQTLDTMGGSLATAFVQAANRDMNAARTAIDTYGMVKYNYVREVDAHSHWIGLSMILIVLGAIFDRVSFSLVVRNFLAWSLLLGSTAFPLGVILQATHRASYLSTAIAIAGSALVIAGMAGTALGLASKSRETQH